MAIQNIAKERIVEICNLYKDEPTPLMMILSDIHKEFGWGVNTEEVLDAIHRTGKHIFHICYIISLK